MVYDVLAGLVTLFFLLILFRRPINRAIIRWWEAGESPAEDQLSEIIAREKAQISDSAKAKSTSEHEPPAS